MRYSIPNPEFRLETIRKNPSANQCGGRGRSTAASRGYNAERLASAVLDPESSIDNFSNENLYDVYIDESLSPHADSIYVECKSCVYRYPSGGYGRFRIWEDNHLEFLNKKESSSDEHIFAYFFVVYTIENGVEQEVGKVLVPALHVDHVIDWWSYIEHDSMGETWVRDISWHHLFEKLCVTPEELVEKDAINLMSILFER